MRNLLALIGFVVVLFFTVGYFRGWYTFDMTTGTDGKTNVNIGVDRNKVGNDIHEGVNKAGETIEKLKTKPATDPQVQPAAGVQPPAASLPGPVGK